MVIVYTLNHVIDKQSDIIDNSVLQMLDACYVTHTG